MVQAESEIRIQQVYVETLDVISAMTSRGILAADIVYMHIGPWMQSTEFLGRVSCVLDDYIYNIQTYIIVVSHTASATSGFSSRSVISAAVSLEDRSSWHRLRILNMKARPCNQRHSLSSSRWRRTAATLPILRFLYFFLLYFCFEHVFNPWGDLDSCNFAFTRKIRIGFQTYPTRHVLQTVIRSPDNFTKHSRTSISGTASGA